MFGFGQWTQFEWNFRRSCSDLQLGWVCFVFQDKTRTFVFLVAIFCVEEVDQIYSISETFAETFLHNLSYWALVVGVRVSDGVHRCVICSNKMDEPLARAVLCQHVRFFGSNLNV